MAAEVDYSIILEAVECRPVIKFLYLKGHTPKETFDEMKVHGDNAPSYDIVKYWHHHVKCGWTLVEIAPIPGRPHSAIDDNTIHKVEATILEDRHMATWQLAQEVKTNVGLVKNVIHDHLHMWKLFA
ncbi:uncharacterized protein LOC106881013 [Octopus bimaculoides]|uniref:uncharacterized protein LOC106881013 n=1 Tax=Octopus bimaculoides TaxID=37653 RepID=UPI00071CB219|nr:uncharacterized protein LOC106881013 [Octopus bimaculoides]|eukprot:XP_014786685.1 PREDICTED: uncharacterized protein LOC106881013 [Octopus bimaculoides]